MDKKNIILELSSELIEKIDRLNNTGDRSVFISQLIEKQLQNSSKEFVTKMSNDLDLSVITEHIDLVADNGTSLGKFDINKLEGFEDLLSKIKEISNDPAVQIRASCMF